MKELSTDAIVAEIQRLNAQLAETPDRDPMSLTNQQLTDLWKDLERRVRPQLFQVAAMSKNNDQRQKLIDDQPLVLLGAVKDFCPVLHFDRTFAFHGFYRQRLIWFACGLKRAGGTANTVQAPELFDPPAKGSDDVTAAVKLMNGLQRYRDTKRMCLDRIQTAWTSDIMHSSVLIMERCGATLKLQSMPIDIVKQAAGAVSYADCFVWIELWNADDECRMFAEFKPEFDDPNQERMTISLSMLYAALSAPIDEGHAVRYEHVAIAVQHAAESETPLIRADAIRQRICRARPILEANLKPSELRLFFQDPGRQVEDN